MISFTKNEKCEVDLMKRRCSGKAEAVEANLDFRYALQKFLKDCENFAIIAKISQSLVKFSLCSNFL